MSKKDDKVGYKKPPKKHRFKKGQSGNPKGRPKIDVDFVNIIMHELNKNLTITQFNKRTKISTREAIVKKLILNAAAGDLRALKTIMKHMPGETKRVCFKAALNQSSLEKE